MGLERKYYYSKKKVSLSVSQRVEFFLHYWDYIMSAYQWKIDNKIFKSHRTVLEKVRLQLEGNYKHSRRYLQSFFIDDELFSPLNSFIIKYENENLRSLRLLVPNRSITNHQKQTLEALVKVEKTFLKKYCTRLVSMLYRQLSKKDNLYANYHDVNEIKWIVNALIVELKYSGYNWDYLKKLPEQLFKMDGFPFPKLRTEFASDELYSKYKREYYKKIDLKLQLNGIVNLVDRPKRKFSVIFKVFDINLTVEPVLIGDVLFYNPVTHPQLILPPKRITLFKEDFTNTHGDYFKSYCNATVIVNTRQDELAYSSGFDKVSKALQIFNHFIEGKGKLNRVNSFLSNEAKTTMWGSTLGMYGHKKTVEELNPSVVEQVEYINQLDLSNSKDSRIFNVISEQVKVFDSNTLYDLKDLWILLESSIGEENRVKEVLFSAVKLYVHLYFLSAVKIYLHRVLSEPLFHNPDRFYFLKDNLLKKYGLHTEIGKRIYTMKMVRSINAIDNHFSLAFITDYLSNVKSFSDNPILFYNKLNIWCDSLLSELYVERNLNVHKKMSDSYIALKKEEFDMLTRAYSSILLRTHFKYKKRKTLESINDIIVQNARSI